MEIDSSPIIVHANTIYKFCLIQVIVSFNIYFVLFQMLIS